MVVVRGWAAAHGVRWVGAAGGLPVCMVCEVEVANDYLMEHACQSYRGLDIAIGELCTNKPIEENDGGIINLETVEVLARKMYGGQLSFSRVKERADWEKPKNAPAQWRSKFAPQLAEEYDIAAVDAEDVAPVDKADRGVQSRLKNRALVSKHLGSPTGSSGD